MVIFNCDNINWPPPTTVATTITTVATTAILLTTVVNNAVPHQLQSFISAKFKKLAKTLNPETTVVVDEFNGIAPNQMFEAANDYLGRKLSPWTRRISACKNAKESEIRVSIDVAEEIVDFFEGVRVTWVLLSDVKRCGEVVRGFKKDGDLCEMRYFELTFHHKFRDFILSRYLRYVLDEAKKIKESTKEIKLHTVDYDHWTSINLDHPATFDKIAMNPDMKTDLIEDLDRFITRKEYYRRVGKAWKRGYLLYGPPGTGKSSIVAAMANYLKFDVYDLDLREVLCNGELRRLLIGTASKSILVIEDIDCSIKLQNRECAEDGAKSDNDDEKVTLSGLLNFVDGLWSTCGDERIIVFTTNHKDRLDPAFLRPGRMDVHIEMSYCTFDGFKLLATNYLGIHDHPMYNRIEDLLRKVQVTPAQVAGELMKSDFAEDALQKLVTLLMTFYPNSEGELV
ncbi:hypothetical protein RND81_08G050700 [Saponaria officinalis]|uniref:AAA+ ATPase domain-containing protein n=1 Tax=Saponaria officinalis TaxID=3572 RepID=A0AAW1J2T8_SAPOF